MDINLDWIAIILNARATQIKLHDHLNHNKDIYYTTMNINVKYFWYIFRSQVSAYQSLLLI